MKFVAPIIFVVAAAAQNPTVDRVIDPVIEPVKTTMVITAKPDEPAVDRRNSEVFDRTLFSRDDQDARCRSLDRGGRPDYLGK